MAKFDDLSGMTFGRLKVIRRGGPNKFGQHYWECICDCGNSTNQMASKLKKGMVKSCGCLRIEKIKSGFRKIHGMTNTRTYHSWVNMMARCKYVIHNRFKNYGGRGISVCERWLHFENFFEDMGECPDGCSIDRIDNNGNYQPDNCRWATASQQAQNRSTTIINMDTAQNIRLDRRNGLSRKEIINKYGVSLHIVKDVLSRRSWAI